MNRLVKGPFWGLSLFIITYPLLSQQVMASWVVKSDTDRLSGVVEEYAVSDHVAPMDGMEFPYQDVESWLAVSCNTGKEKTAYIGFSESPNIINAATKDGYNVIKTRIRWDGVIEGGDIRVTVLTQEWGSRFLFFGPDKDAPAEMLISEEDSMTLELNWFGNGKVYFKYSLAGSTQAMNQVCPKN